MSEQKTHRGSSHPIVKLTGERMKKTHCFVCEEPIEKHTANGCPECSESSLNALLLDNFLVNPVRTFFSPGLAKNCVVDQNVIDSAVANGERVVAETVDGTIEAYYWHGHIYVTSMEIKPETGR